MFHFNSQFLVNYERFVQNIKKVLTYRSIFGTFVGLQFMIQAVQYSHINDNHIDILFYNLILHEL